MKKLKSLKVKMPIMIISIALPFLSFIIILTAKQASYSLEEATYTGLKNTVHGYLSVIETILKEQFTIASMYSTESEITAFIENPTEENKIALKEELTKLDSMNKNAINAGVIDLEGNIIFDVKYDNLIGKNMFEINPELRNSYIGSILIKGENGNWALPVTKEVTNASGNKIGYVYIIIDWQYLNDLHFSDFKLGNSGNIFTVGGDNFLIRNHNNTSNMGVEAPPQYQEAFSSSQKTGTLKFIFSGDKRTCAYEKFDDMNWLIGISVTEKEMYARTTSLIWQLIIISIIVMVLYTIFISMFTKSITKPLRVLVGVANEIAEGNLTTTKQKIKREDELGELSDAFVSMRRNLVETITVVKESAKNITMAAKELSEQNNDLSHRTESQAASIEQTSASMNEISSNVKISANNSISSNQMITDVKSSVTDAGNIILETTNNIEEVHQASNKIKDITKIIEDIAFQTNLLALNASVEAARAGENGKGFAVVASEVRNLALNTQTSVKDITILIGNVYEKISKATETARQSQEIFNDIQSKIEEASITMESISHNAAEQQNGIEQIKIAINEMDDMTQKNAALVEEANAAAETLFAQSEELTASVNLFKLPH